MAKAKTDYGFPIRGFLWMVLWMVLIFFTVISGGWGGDVRGENGPANRTQNRESEIGNDTMQHTAHRHNKIVQSGNGITN